MNLVYKSFRLLPRYKAQIVDGKVYDAQQHLGDRLIKQFREWEKQGLTVLCTIQARDEAGDFLLVVLREKEQA